MGEASRPVPSTIGDTASRSDGLRSVAAIVTLLRRARLASTGLLIVLLLGASVRSFLGENLPTIQRMKANPFQSYDARVDYRWNEFSRFMRFIDARTPEDAVVVFPTGGRTGFFIERRSLAGYFLYPRTVISSHSITPSSGATHVVTADGAHHSSFRARGAHLHPDGSQTRQCDLLRGAVMFASRSTACVCWTNMVR